MKTDNIQTTPSQPDDQRFWTVPQAARATGIPSYKIRRAVKLGVIPSYGVLDCRRYVRINDIYAVMACRTEVASSQALFVSPVYVGSKGGSQ